MNTLEKKAKQLLSYMDTIVQHFVVEQTNMNQSSLECPMSLNKHELRIIDVLGQKDYCTMSEIAEQIKLAVSTLTGIIDSMVEKKIVSRERAAHDRRMVIVKLDEQGSKVFEMHREAKGKISHGILTSLDEDEQKTILELFEKISNKILAMDKN